MFCWVCFFLFLLLLLLYSELLLFYFIFNEHCNRVDHTSMQFYSEEKKKVLLKYVLWTFFEQNVQKRKKQRIHFGIVFPMEPTFSLDFRMNGFIIISYISDILAVQIRSKSTHKLYRGKLNVKNRIETIYRFLVLWCFRSTHFNQMKICRILWKSHEKVFRMFIFFKYISCYFHFDRYCVQVCLFLLLLLFFPIRFLDRETDKGKEEMKKKSMVAVWPVFNEFNTMACKRY